jgi:hypothetical protein
MKVSTVAQLIFAGFVVLAVSALVYTGATSSEAGIPVIAAALGYVFGAGAQASAESAGIAIRTRNDARDAARDAARDDNL